MYNHPRRRGGHLAGVRDRQVPVGAHSGTVADFLCRHERDAIATVRGNPAAKKTFLADLLDRTADSRNLRLAWNHLAADGGQAPGKDGLHYDDLDDREVWKLIRTIRKAILDDTYRPGTDLKVPIPKSSGKGTRPLLISSIVDRLVQRAVVQTVQPYIDPQFDDHSYGYRPRRDRQHALARAEQLATSSKSWVWVAEDIRDAFNQVSQHRLLDVVRLRLPNEGIVRLIEKVVLTKTGRGLRQGGCLSPLLLNLYLDHHLDRRWRKRHEDLPLLRVADDLLVLAPTGGEAHQAWSDLKELLSPAGMPLKGSPSSAVGNLSSGEDIDWLGFHITKGKDGLEACLAEKSWNKLRDQLEVTHTKPDTPLRAVAVINGWADQLGPCYSWSDRQEVYARVTTTARELAFDEIPSREEFLYRWGKSCERWSRIRSDTKEQYWGLTESKTVK